MGNCALILVVQFIVQFNFQQVNSQHVDFIRAEPYFRALVEAEEVLYFILKELRASRVWADVDQHGLDLEVTRYFEDVEDNSGLNLKVYSDPGSIRKNDNYKIISRHPLLCYRLVYRFVKHVPIIIDSLMELEGAEVLIAKFEDALNTAVIPQQTSLDEASADLLRLLHTYDLRLYEFAAGIINGKHTGYALQPKHCYEIARFTLRENTYPYLGVEWFEYIGMLFSKPLGSLISNETFQVELEQAINLHESEWDAHAEDDETLFMSKIRDPTMKMEAEFNGLPRRARRRTFICNSTRGIVDEAKDEESNYWRLCSGDDLMPIPQKAKLNCWYESKSHPAWFINPLKIELLSNSPFVIQIYEFLSNKKTNKLAEHIRMRPRLRKSQVHSPNKTTELGEITAKYKRRSSGSKWLESTDPDSLFISKRIEYVTGLLVTPTSAGEKLQFAIYSYGQHYATHADAFGYVEKRAQPENGDRIATFMIYLTDVEMGGFTVFTRAHAVGIPIRGSAVFWYNMYRNGTVDSRLRHGACPVLIGNKIVVNKWIRSADQFLHRKCSLISSE